MTDPSTEPTVTTPEVSIRERGKAERRLRVVETATSILAAGGVEALSMRVLSVESGVSLPTIYNLIGGRDDVLGAVLDQLGAVFDAEVATSTTDALERCFEITDRLLDTMTTHATLARSIIAEGLTSLLGESGSSPFQRYGIALLTALVEASETGDLVEEAEPILIVDQMVSLTAVRIFRWATGNASSDGEQLHAAVTHGIGLILAGAASLDARERVLTQVRKSRIALLGGTDT